MNVKVKKMVGSFGHLNIAELLLKAGADIDFHDGYLKSPLMAAAQEGQSALFPASWSQWMSEHWFEFQLWMDVTPNQENKTVLKRGNTSCNKPKWESCGYATAGLQSERKEEQDRNDP